jgi:glucose/mannose transport system substrate-binding protein
MNIRLAASCGLTVMLALATTGAARADDMRAEVIHWWTSGGESAAVRVFAEQFDQQGGHWVDNAVASGANARTAAINRIVGGDPPTASQFNTGKQFDDLVENDLLTQLDTIAAQENWKAVIPPPILAAVVRHGHDYAAPVDIHGQNWVFWSKDALAKAGAQPPTNWTDLFQTLDKLKAAGLVPLAFSGQKTWERGLFNDTLVGVGGKAMFVDFWGNRDAALAKSPEFRKVAETFRRLRNYIDPASPGRNWNDATAMVIQGKAGLQFMGDWAKGEFTAASQTAGQQYGCTVLGDHGVPYVMGGDVFVFPRLNGSTTPSPAQALLIKVMLDPATQLAFSQKKGSIPVRQDVDVSSLDECARKAVQWLKDPNTQVPANELLSPPALTGAMEDVISAYWNNSDMTTDDFLKRVADVLSQPL